MNLLRNVRKITLVIILMTLLSACAGVRPNIAIPNTMPQALVMQTPPRIALVLGSGGAKGYAHIGVLTVLQQAGIPVDLIVGSSAGSAIGALYADSGNATKVRHIMMGAKFWDLADVSNTPSLKGPIKGYRFQKFLLRNMRARDFNELQIPLIIATTDLQSGRTIALSSGPIPPAITASAAIPGAVQPIHLYGYTLIDGGMTDPVPVNIAKRYHPKIIIAVDISNELNNKLPTTAVGIYDRGFAISWIQLTNLSMQGADVLIQPHVGTVGVFEMSQKWKMYQMGVAAAKRALPQIKKLMDENKIPYKNP